MTDRYSLDDLLAPAAASPSAQAVAPFPASAVAGKGVSYDGANQLDQLAGWAPALRSADADLLFDKPMLDARSRDTIKNDAYVGGASTVHKDNIAGEEFRLNCRISSKLLFGAEDEKWDEEASEEIEERWRVYAESPMCWPDAQRVNTLTGLVRLALGQHLMGGEVLASAEWKDDGRPFASNIQMIDPDRLSTPNTVNTFDWKIRSGVERTKAGAPIAYHIRNAHLSDGYNTSADVLNWTRVKRFTSWGRPQMLHIYETLRPDQSRGVSAMVSALTEMRMLKHFRKTELQRAVIAASYAASIETDFPAEAAEMMGVATGPEDNRYVGGMMEFMSAMNDYLSSAKNIHMDGVKIPVFMPNTHLKIQNPGAESPAGSEFEQSMLRYLAAALGLSYEQFSRDYTNTNYSSARASIGEALRGMRPRKRMVADGTANFVFRLWIEEAINYADLECFKRRNMPSFYEGQNAEFYTAAEWIGAGQGMIDPLKETQASVLAIKNGLSTQDTEIARRYGSDWRRVKKQAAREMKMDEALGLPSIYADPNTQDMENALSGSAREASNAE